MKKNVSFDCTDIRNRIEKRDAGILVLFYLCTSVQTERITEIELMHDSFAFYRHDKMKSEVGTFTVETPWVVQHCMQILNVLYLHLQVW